MSSLRDGAPISPDVRSFFRAIKENPDDDTPRLIFADWLQERGDAASAARGEYLRLSVMRHRLPPDDPDYELIKRREAEIFTEHRWQWLGPLTDAARGWTFERGMVQITASADKLLTSEVADWARTEPSWWIDALKLTDLTPSHIKRLVRFPLLSHLNTLDLSDNQNFRNGIRRLLDALCAAQMHCLARFLLCRVGFSRIPYTAWGFAGFVRLNVLDLRHNRLDDTVARMLTSYTYFPEGATILLGHNRITEVGRELLRRAFGDRVQF